MVAIVLGIGCLLPLRPAAAAEYDPPAVSSASPGLPPIQIWAKSPQKEIQALDEARDAVLMPKLGASDRSISSAAIEALPQGQETDLDKVLLQMPGVNYDAAVNHDGHIRNEYQNSQIRIDGIMLPEGVSQLGPILDTSLVGNFSLLDGALPAQYGLRTSGVLDITTKSLLAPEGHASLYGGSHDTFSPRADYGGTTGRTQYFVTARYMRNDMGMENTTPNVDAIHDKTEQGKFFGYFSRLVGDESRLSLLAGAAVGQFQIPDNPNQTPLGDYGGASANSAGINENERDAFYFGVLALQTHGEDFDSQLSVYSRYAEIHFIPDSYNDLVFNDVASDVKRESVLSGAQYDASKRLDQSHTLRFGFDASAEQTNTTNVDTVLPGAIGAVTGAPITIDDDNSKLGVNLGVYAQDEWTLTEDLTLNYGVRFDQLYQFVDANQLSPRVALVDKPYEGTTLHAAYARYFTPPMQSEATPTNLAAFQGTTAQPAVPYDDPVRPERSHYFDVGVEQDVLPGLTAGLDGFYKLATDQLDDGQFGQAVTLRQFNLARGYKEGVETTARYHDGGLSAYANFSAIQTMVKDVVSNQYLIADPAEFAYDATHYHYSDDNQVFTASYGVSYRRGPAEANMDSIYGSGLRSGFANIDHVAPYDVVNAGLAWKFDPWSNNKKLLTARVEVVNLFDSPYMLRSGTGIGEFAPQYGQRRGVFGSLSQAF